MRRTLQIDPSSAVPIWHQIEEGLRRLVASGALAAGAAVPSVRDLARELTINPATVAKAYQRLCDSGVLVVRRGEGTFVADAPPKLERTRELREAADRYAGVAATLGATVEQATTTVAEAMNDLGGEKRWSTSKA